MVFPNVDNPDHPAYPAHQIEKLLNEHSRNHGGLSLEMMLYIIPVVLIRMRAFLEHNQLHEVLHGAVDYTEEAIEAQTGTFFDTDGNVVPFITAEQRNDPGYKAIEAQLAAGIPDYLPEDLL